MMSETASTPSQSLSVHSQAFERPLMANNCKNQIVTTHKFRIKLTESKRLSFPRKFSFSLKSLFRYHPNTKKERKNNE